MINIWFGLDAGGFEKAPDFDKIFGPVLMVTYACLSNTLLLTGMWPIYDNYAGQRPDYCRSLSLDPFSYILHDI